jgi:hypothetical protein
VFLLANSKLNIGTTAGESNIHKKLSIQYYGILYPVAMHFENSVSGRFVASVRKNLCDF